MNLMPELPPGYEDLYIDYDEANDKAKGKGKRPAVLFYPKDLLGDHVYIGRSDHARHLWLVMLLLMDRAEPYGHLANHGGAMSMRELGRVMGWGVKKTQRALANLEEGGMFSRNAEGVIYCRRMVRDGMRQDALDAANKLNGLYGVMGKEHGAEGGRGNKKGRLQVVGGADSGAANKPPPGVSETPLSSSSASSISKEKTTDVVSSEIEKSNAGAGSGEVHDELAKCVALMAAAGVKNPDDHYALTKKYVDEGLRSEEMASVLNNVDCRDKPPTFALGVLRNRRLEAAKAPSLPPLPEAAPPAPLVSTTHVDHNPGRPPHEQERGELDALKKRLRSPKAVKKPETAPVDAE